jgi:cyclic pyranopterin phosphate synthase
MSQVDIGGKAAVRREAVAEGYIRLRSETIERVVGGHVEKGDPITISKLVGLMAAKQTPILLPLCHNIQLDHVELTIWIDEEKQRIGVRSKVSAHAKTGVEMEALTSVTVTLLNIWDMVKQYEKDDRGHYPQTLIESVRIVSKMKEAPQ